MGLTVRFDALKHITERFDVLWNYLDMSAEVIDEKARVLAAEYSSDVDENLVTEMQHLPFVHSANFEKTKLLPLDLLNKIYEFKLRELFPNLCICLRILLTIPATVASAERSFSKLKLIKNYLRSISCQSLVVHLARLSIESKLAEELKYDQVIKIFAEKKARKVFLNQSRHFN